MDTRSFKSEFNVKDLRFATPEEVLQLTQLQIGAIPPFGKLFEIPTYVDENLSANENIAFNAGDRCKSIIMRYKDYIEASGGIIGRYAAK